MPLTNGSGFGSVEFHHFSKIKVQKKSQNSRNQGFSYYFCLIEGSGSIPLTNGSGSGMPKTMWIRIRNTGFHSVTHCVKHLLFLVEEVVQTCECGSAGPAVPRTVFQLLASKACRGAVMFGEALKPRFCAQLLRQLAQCRAPFQCAHGRPSLAPLIYLDGL
jgi:hypothetical protein